MKNSRLRHALPNPEESSADELSPGVVSFVENFGSRPAPVDPAQAATVVKRLRVLLGEALENARRCGVELRPPALVAVCDELLREVRDPGYRPDFGESVEGFLLSGLFDELVQQPSNIFEIATSPDGREYYVSLSPENWAACLAVLRLSLSPHQ